MKTVNATEIAISSSNQRCIQQPAKTPARRGNDQATAPLVQGGGEGASGGKLFFKEHFVKQEI